MALTDKDILIAVKRTSDAAVHLANVDHVKFPRRDFGFLNSSDQYVSIDATKHEWSNYFKSGLKVSLLLRSVLIQPTNNQSTGNSDSPSDR